MTDRQRSCVAQLDGPVNPAGPAKPAAQGQAAVDAAVAGFLVQRVQI